MKRLHMLGFALATALCTGGAQAEELTALEKSPGNRRDHAWLPRYLDSVLLPGRRSEAGRLRDDICGKVVEA